MGSVLLLCMWISEYPNTIIEKTVFSPLSILGTLIKYYSWVYFWALGSVPLVYVSVFMAVPYCFEAFTVVYLGIKKCVPLGFLCLFGVSCGFCFIDYAKAFDCVDYNKLENSLRDGDTRPPDLPLEKPVCRSGSNS